MSGEEASRYTPANVAKDLTASVVVFLVALPLCLGIALASNAPMLSGLIAGIVGGIVVGSISGSHTSVSGPAAGLAAVVVSQLEALGSFEAFALCVVFAGVIQIALGMFKAGFIAAFFPSSVIKGLLAAIGVLLILKQFPHVFGHDPDPVGEMDFKQPDGENTFTELIATFFDVHPGAAVIGLTSVALLFAWPRIRALKNSPVPAPLVVVALGLALAQVLKGSGPTLEVGISHLVQMPEMDGVQGALAALTMPDWGQLGNPAVYVGALTIGIVATLETLLNLEAVDKIDPEQRHSPPNRELIAQGAGNLVSGLLGGLPVTSVIVRSSVNVATGAKSRISAIAHGIILMTATLLIPDWLSKIPLSCLAAILLATGFKLASPALFKAMWKQGRAQFLPFIATIVAIVLIDLLIGVLIGLGVAATFILYSNYNNPLRRVMEHHVNQDVMRIQLSNQVSFFNRAALEKTLAGIPEGGHVLIDARDADFIDPDVLDLISDFKAKGAPARKINVSVVGLREHYSSLEDEIQFVDYSSRDLQARISPDQVLELLRQGNQRFIHGRRIERDLMRQVRATAPEANPLAVVVACIDSRSPSEIIFDLGIGDIFSVRIAGNVAPRKVIGSIEYATRVAGAKLILVLGHTSCQAIKLAVDSVQERPSQRRDLDGCESVESFVSEIERVVDPKLLPAPDAPKAELQKAIDAVAKRNVLRTMRKIVATSPAVREMVENGDVEMAGGLYDIHTGEVTFYRTEAVLDEELSQDNMSLPPYAIMDAQASTTASGE